MPITCAFPEKGSRKPVNPGEERYGNIVVEKAPSQPLASYPS